MPEDTTNEPTTEFPSITPMALRWSRKDSTRLQVFAAWMVVAILWAITRSAVFWQLLELISLPVLGFFLWPFIQGPCLLYWKGSRRLRSDYRVLAGQTEPDLSRYRTRDLLGMGFRFAGQLVREPGARNVGVRIAMFIHSENQDSAQVAQVASGLRTIPRLVFKSRFHDGFGFETSDSGVAHIFKVDPAFPVFRFPGIRSTEDLYRLHRKIKEQFVPPHRPTIADAQGELAAFMARAEIIHQRHANSGDYKFGPYGYVYTWRGAIRHAWLLAWPVKQLRAIGVHRDGMKTAEKLGLPINPKFGCLEDSLPHHNRPA